MPDRIVVKGGAAAWNPRKQCWQFTDIYWEPGFPWDNEWEDDECFVARTEYVLWIQTSCFVRDEKNDLKLIERTRTSSQSYVLAERYCKESVMRAWTERPPDRDSPLNEEWDVEDEYWKAVR